MKRIVLWLLSSVSVLTLLFSYHTSTSSSLTTAAPGSSAAPVISSGASSGGPGGPGPDGTPSSDPTAQPVPPATSSTQPTAATVTGTRISTRYGPVQVRIRVSGGRLASVSVPVYPSGSGTDRQINSRALPVLVAETMTVRGANIDMVSGATYTSHGYVQSLQSALDQAGL